MNWRIPKRERYRKPVVILQNGNEGIDFAAYCRSIGVEAYMCMDLQDLNEIAHILWERKAIANTRALVLTAGGQPTFGIQSLIRAPEILRQKYGFEVVKLPFNSIVPYMDAITDEEARPIAEKIIKDANGGLQGSGGINDLPESGGDFVSQAAVCAGRPCRSPFRAAGGTVPE